MTESFGEQFQFLPLFVQQLYKMLENTATDDIIAWHKSGQSFLIHDKPRFIAELLREYFNHQSFPSFHRQLNNYKFSKVNPPFSKSMKFKHPFFVRGDI